MDVVAAGENLDDPGACARWLVSAIGHMDGCVRPGVRSVRVGPAYLAIDPSRDTPFPSNNPNRALLIADGKPIDGAVIDGIIAAFRAAGVKRFFLWLLPGERATGEYPELEQRGIEVFDGPHYVMLIRSAAGPVAGSTSLIVREMLAADVDQHGPALAEGLEQPRLAVGVDRGAGFARSGSRVRVVCVGDGVDREDFAGKPGARGVSGVAHGEGVSVGGCE